MQLQQREQVFEDMGPGNRQAQFFHQRLQKLFRTLLAKKTGLIMQGIASAVELAGGSVVARSVTSSKRPIFRAAS